MHRIATAITLAATLAFAPAAAPLAQAQAKAKDVNALAVPVTGVARETGAKFAGTFTLQRFINDNGEVKAVGIVAGTLTDAAGVVSAIQNVAVPVSIGDPAGLRAAAISAQAVCSILHLDLGPLTLNLLGLQVDLSRVVLDITAIQGAGNLLGNLLCAVAGLLDNPGGLAALLNQILGALGL